MCCAGVCGIRTLCAQLELVLLSCVHGFFSTEFRQLGSLCLFRLGLHASPGVGVCIAALMGAMFIST